MDDEQYAIIMKMNGFDDEIIQDRLKRRLKGRQAAIELLMGVQRVRELKEKIAEIEPVWQTDKDFRDGFNVQAEIIGLEIPMDLNYKVKDDVR